MKRKISLIILTILTVLLFALGIIWLGVVLLVSLGIYSIVTSHNSLIRKIIHSKWFSVPSVVIIIFAMAIFIRLFVFEVYEIPSNSMENTLLIGDKIVVNKLKLGPLTPESPFDIPWFNLFFYMNKKARASVDSVWWKRDRLSGFNKLKRGDVVVFQSAWDKNYILIKRCVALPGDTFSVVNSELIVNNHKQPDYSDLIKKRYNIYTRNIEELSRSLKQNRIDSWVNTKDQNGYSLELTGSELNRLITNFHPDSLMVDVLLPRSEPLCFPFDSVLRWNIDQFGPLWIPQKGDTISLNKINFMIYTGIINDLEKAKIEKKDSLFFCEGKQVSFYTFKNNYCFMMGDNRNYSMDSRYWAFVPEMNIIGRATKILWSNNEDRLKWNRFLKTIR